MFSGYNVFYPKAFFFQNKLKMIKLDSRGTVAELVERATFRHGVMGSIHVLVALLSSGWVSVSVK